MANEGREEKRVRFLTAREVAERYGQRLSWVYGCRSLPRRKVGKYLIFREDELEDFELSWQKATPSYRTFRTKREFAIASTVNYAETRRLAGRPASHKDPHSQSASQSEDAASADLIDEICKLSRRIRSVLVATIQENRPPSRTSCQWRHPGIPLSPNCPACAALMRRFRRHPEALRVRG